MNDQLKNRLSELKAEYEAGQKALAELRKKQEDLQAALIRIDGAIQELQTQMKKAGTDGSAVQHPARKGQNEG